MAVLGTVLSVLGWILWGLALVYGVAVTFSSHPDGGVRSMMRTQGLVLLTGCALTALLPISKLWLLLAVPVAFFLPMLLMQQRAGTAQRRLQELREESRRTGVPLTELMDRELNKMGE